MVYTVHTLGVGWISKDEKAIEITKKLFKTNPLFNIESFTVMLASVVL